MIATTKRVHRFLRAAAPRLAGLLTGIVTVAGVWGSVAVADPAEDALAKLNELSRQAEQMTEAMHSAQLDLTEKVRLQAAAEKQHADDTAALTAARDRLVGYQAAVDKLAVSVYLGGQADGLHAMLTARSPQGLIDTISVQRVMGIEMSAQMKNYRQLSDEAARIEAASAKSAAEAKVAADQAAAVRAELQRKQSQLQVQIAAVKARYLMLSPDQRAALAAPAPPAEAPKKS